MPATAATAAESPSSVRDLLLDAANLSIDQLPMLPVVLDRIANNLADRLKHLSSVLLHFTLNSMECARVGDTLDAYEMKAVAGVLYAPAWDNRVVAGFERNFVFTMAEALFGGDGTEIPTEDERTFSNIETHLCRFLLEQLGLALQAAFAPLSATRFQLERTETRMDFAGVGRRNNPAIVARFLFQALNRGGEMFIILPQSALSQMRQGLSRVAARDQPPADPAWLKQISEEVHRTSVTIRAVLEAPDYTLGEIASLKVGQVLKLQATQRTRIKVESNEQPLFWSYLGQSDGHHTLRIDEVIDQEREFINDVLAR